MANDEWETPQWLFDELDKEFNFDVDVAANVDNTKCLIFYKDGLKAETWKRFKNSPVEHENVWMNPPYSRGQLYKWCKKAYEESQKGVTVVGLLPVDTSTKWFHEWIWFNPLENKPNNIQVRFLPKRLKFELNGIPEGTARFASMIVIWRGAK